MTIQSEPITNKPTTPRWQGLHHVALVTRDLDATMRFYTEVLGMKVIFNAPAGAMHGRHCAIQPGGNPDTLGLHFFEYAKALSFEPGERPLTAATVFDPGETFLSHISFALPNEEAGLALQARLSQHNVAMTPIMPQGTLWLMGFLDNNGLPLEAVWPKKT